MSKMLSVLLENVRQITYVIVAHIMPALYESVHSPGLS